MIASALFICIALHNKHCCDNGILFDSGDYKNEDSFDFNSKNEIQRNQCSRIFQNIYRCIYNYDSKDSCFSNIETEKNTE